jgi:hypothetical protein
LVFSAVFHVASALVYSPPVYRVLSIDYRADIKWVAVILFWVMLSGTLCVFPAYGGKHVKLVKVFLPILITASDVVFSKITERAYSEYRKNRKGPFFFVGMYIWRMESTRFACFHSLYHGYKNGTGSYEDVLLNSIFSIVAEVWAHTGIHELVEVWLDRKFQCFNLKCQFPEIRLCLSSVRAIMEWVIPVVHFFGINLLEWCRDYIAVPDDDELSELYFFSSFRLLESLWEVILFYYLIETISKIVCSFVRRFTGYQQLSVLETLGVTGILAWCAAMVIRIDCSLNGIFWSTVDAE